MLISIIVEKEISDWEVSKLIDFYERFGMIVIVISDYHVVIRDENVTSVEAAGEYLSYSAITLNDFMNGIVQNAA